MNSANLRKSRKVGDYNQSLNNSWMVGSSKNQSLLEESFSRKSRLLGTASKLGRKLIAMDKESDKVQEAQQRTSSKAKPSSKKTEEHEKNQWKKF